LIWVAATVLKVVVLVGIATLMVDAVLLALRGADRGG
jgi:hypothetical protein